MLKILSIQLAIKPIITVNNFLNLFKKFNTIDIQKGIFLDFEYNYNSNSHKINPLIQLFESLHMLFRSQKRLPAH